MQGAAAPLYGPKGVRGVETFLVEAVIYVLYAAIGAFYPALLKEAFTDITLREPGGLAGAAVKLGAAMALAGLNYVLFLYLLRQGEVGVVFTVASALIMVASSFVAVRRFGEVLTISHWAGLGLVGAGCALVMS